MSEEIFKNMAAQLRKPEGEAGKQVAIKMNSGNALINRKAIEELHISDGEKILELGMGNGFFVKEILAAANNVKYSGCDYSATMITEAMALNKKFVDNNQAAFYQATADKLPFPNETFDKAFGVNIIYFWQQPHIELAEIYRVLKPGGKLVIAIRPKDSMEKYPFVKYGFTTYSKHDLVLILKKNGFKIDNEIEENEPDQQVNDLAIKVALLIITASKT